MTAAMESEAPCYWYSCRLRFVVLVEPEGADHYADSVILLRARSFEHAQERAIALASTHETEYLNQHEQRVSWRLKEVLTLDLIGANIDDGAEVFFESVDLEPNVSFPFDCAFAPDQSRPRHTF